VQVHQKRKKGEIEKRSRVGAVRGIAGERSEKERDWPLTRTQKDVVGH